MSEIKRAPIMSSDENGDEFFTFDASHTWADVARWAVGNPSDGEELHRILAAMLAGSYTETLQ